jgi:hypothetical protein
VIDAQILAARRRAQRGARRRVLAAALLLALMQPALAYPYTLDQLLAMPIEQLLTIPIMTTGGAR